jgi:hypothetical protein
MTRDEIQATLQAVFELSRANLHIDAGSIGRAVGLSATRAAEALLVLESKGMVDASRARLTMKGLVVAVSGGGGLAGVRPDLEAARSQPARRENAVWNEEDAYDPDGGGMDDRTGIDGDTRYI